MHPSTGVAGQQRIAGDNGFLGGTWPACQSEPRGVGSLVGDGADGEPRLFGVLRDQDTQARGVLEGPAHDQRVVDADAVVGEHPHLTGTGVHHAHLGELRSGQAHGDRSHRVHVDQADLLTAMPDMVGDDGAVGHRIGVGHREHRGVAAQSRCRRAGFDVLGVLAARLTQVGVQVDEAGEQDLAGGVDGVGVFGDGQARADIGDLAVGNQHVDPVALAVQTHPSNHCRHAARHSCADRLLLRAHQQVEQHRHPNMHAIGNLLQYSRLR